VSTPITPPPAAGRSGSGLGIAVLYGIVVALAAVSVYLFLQVDAMSRDLAALQESVQAEVTKVREASALLGSANQRNLEALRAELEEARRNAQSAVGQAREEAVRHAEELARRLQEEQQREQQRLASELSQVREAAGATTGKIEEVAKDVSAVRTEVASTKSELEKTISELKSVRGDLGVQSGLIATNAKELAALKALGDRNYYDFTLTKKQQWQRVGDVSIRLTRTDEKRNRYSILIVADDKQVEKKDKTVNEPVQFYTARARIPYEIVVNQVGKDVITGYLATPKVALAR
jgi:chromosome segregation ATPase